MNAEAASILRSVKERVGIVVVAGKYRTGKSFLLNRILLNQEGNKGFGVGPTINPYTKVLILNLTVYNCRDCKFGASLWKLTIVLENLHSRSLSWIARELEHSMKTKTMILEFSFWLFFSVPTSFIIRWER